MLLDKVTQGMVMDAIYRLDEAYGTHYIRPALLDAIQYWDRPLIFVFRDKIVNNDQTWAWTPCDYLAGYHMLATLLVTLADPTLHTTPDEALCPEAGPELHTMLCNALLLRTFDRDERRESYYDAEDAQRIENCEKVSMHLLHVYLHYGKESLDSNAQIGTWKKVYKNAALNGVLFVIKDEDEDGTASVDPSDAFFYAFESEALPGEKLVPLPVDLKRFEFELSL